MMQGPVWDERHAAALEFVWGQYRIWAATSRQQRAELKAWRWRVLVLTVVGAVLGTVSQYLPNLMPGTNPWLIRSISLLCAVAIALATYFTKEFLSSERERRWIRARSMAEALKAESYVFRSGVSPYNGDDGAVRLNQWTKELLTTVSDMIAVNLTQQQQRERLPKGQLSVAGYIAERVDDQINNFYQPRAHEHEVKLTRLRTITLWLGAIGAALGAAGVIGLTTAGLVAVITTIIAALTTYIAAERYQYLIVSYQATARQLAAVKSEWLASGSPEADGARRHKFIRDCEEVLSIENSGWIAQWSERMPSLIQDRPETERKPTSE